MTTGESAGPALVLGPMLRYVSETEATIWVETDRECQVEVLGRGAPTFEVAGHHYGLVVIDGLAPGSEHEYQVTLDGTVRWPLPGGGFPPSVLRTLGQDRPGPAGVRLLPGGRDRAREPGPARQARARPPARRQATGRRRARRNRGAGRARGHRRAGGLRRDASRLPA